MSITIHEALQLPMMSQTRLAAGNSGLHNIIKWVTIVEVIEDIHRLQEGEFLITTGYGLKNNMNEFHKLLALKKLSGVAIYTGFYLDEIPQSFIDIANEHALPLIEIPTKINFSTITKGILEQILNKQMEIVSFSLKTHKQLTSLVLQNEGIHKVAETLSDVMTSSIFLFDENFAFSYDVTIHPTICFIDEHLLIGEAPIQLVHILQQMSKTNEQTTIKVEPFELRAFPIIANRRCYGFLAAIKEIDKWREIDDAAMEHAITIFAIEYLKLAAVEETQIRLRGEFLEELMNRNFKDKASALEQGKKLGFDLSLKQAVFHIRLPENNTDMDILQERMRHAMAKFPSQYIFHRKRDAFLLLVEVKSQKPHVKSECTEIAAELQKKWLAKYPNSPLTIGIGKPYQDVHKLGDSAQEAKYAVEFSPLLLIKKNIIHYEDLGAFHLLIQMKETGINLNSFYEEHIGQLIEYSKQGMDLVHTLEVFFKNNQGIQPTANELFVHRHTLKYRLNQIQNKTGFDLSCADERMKLQLAILAYKLEKFYENNRKGV